MINFVEYRRAVGAMRIAAIIAGIILLIAIVGRIAVHSQSPDKVLGNLEASPTAHVTRSTLADGSQQTIVDDPAKKIHAVAIVHGSSFRLDLTQPSKGGAETEHFDMANVSVNDVTRKNGTEHVVVQTDRSPSGPIGIFFLTSIIMGFIIASVLGGVLSKENDGHLELAWTKPISRERYALGAFSVDLAAIVASQLLWVAIAFIAAAMFDVRRFSFESGAGWHIGIALLGPIAWYAAVTGWSASVKRGPGVVIGLGWPIALGIPGGAAALAGASHPLLVAIHALLLGLSYIDPLSYVHMHGHGVNVTVGSAGAVQVTAGIACAALAALTAFYLALAVAQWRRVEA